MKPLRVVVLDLLCISPYHDGYFCEALQAEGVDVSLAAISFHLERDYFRRAHLKNDPGLLDIVSRLGIRNTRLRQGLKFIEMFVNLIGLSVRFILAKPDIVHIQWVPLVTRAPLEVWFLRFVKILGAKLVYTVHNVLPHDTSERYKKAYQKLYSTMDSLVCHTTESRERIIAEFGQDPSRVWLIPPGPWFHQSSGLSREEARNALGLKDDDCAVLFFGNIAPYKGLDFLLEGWSRTIRQTTTPAKLMIVGQADAVTAQMLNEQIAALGIQATVDLNLTFVTSTLLVTHHLAADILVYPYKAITHSAALLTGLTFGKAIVATSLPAFCEILQDGKNALLIDYGNVDSLASTLDRMIEDPRERDRLAEGCRQTVRGMKSWRDAAAKSVEMYQAALEDLPPAIAADSQESPDVLQSHH
ncbi:MAG: glycosyltransferase family 4 protein [Terriglobales bacterium]